MSEQLDVKLYYEHELPDSLKDSLSKLLDSCFPDWFFGRSFFKQLPHFRLVATENTEAIAQVSVDHRVINVGGKVVEIFGVIDLCVKESQRGNGIGADLLARVEKTASQSSVEFLVLMADDPRLYHQQGFKSLDVAQTRFLGIDDEKHIGVGMLDKDLRSCFMVKEVKEISWPDGDIDLLGYLF